MGRFPLADRLLTRPPRWLLRPLLPGTEWAGAAGPDPVVYLTFDDGPIPDETPWVLEQLAQFQALGTFFCVGDNLARYPAIARAALAAGHRLGNHTQHHRSAWASPRADFLRDVAACQAQLDGLQNEVAAPLRAAAAAPGNSALTAGAHQPETQVPTSKINGLDPPGSYLPQPLFRPPYGRLTWPLLAKLLPHYRLIMWSLLTRDYDAGLSPEACLRMTLAAVRSGDVLVFHDSRKASARLRFVLPRLLAELAGRGFLFVAI